MQGPLTGGWRALETWQPSSDLQRPHLRKLSKLRPLTRVGREVAGGHWRSPEIPEVAEVFSGQRFFSRLRPHFFTAASGNKPKKAKSDQKSKRARLVAWLLLEVAISRNRRATSRRREPGRIQSNKNRGATYSVVRPLG
jgi:hypothetical protein